MTFSFTVYSLEIMLNIRSTLSHLREYQGGANVARTCNGWSCEYEWRQEQSISTKWLEAPPPVRNLPSLFTLTMKHNKFHSCSRTHANILELFAIETYLPELKSVISKGSALICLICLTYLLLLSILVIVWGIHRYLFQRIWRCSLVSSKVFWDAQNHWHSIEVSLFDRTSSSSSWYREYVNWCLLNPQCGLCQYRWTSSPTPGKGSFEEKYLPHQARSTS